MHRRTSTFLGVFAALLVVATTASAQSHDISPSSAEGVPSEAGILSSMLLDNSEPVRGFSLGVAHDGAVLTLISISEGADLLAAGAGNSSGSIAFWTAEVNPPNGPGGTCGAIVSFTPPLLDIPVGVDHEIAVYSYTISPSAVPGTTTALTPVSTLGNPPLATAVSVNGVTRIPTSTPGVITVKPFPVTGLTCTLSEVCTCEFELSWTNNGTYDEVRILENGVLVASLAGGATASTVTVGATTIGGPASAVYTVVGVQNATAADGLSCTADCPDVPDPIPPSALSCVVDQATRQAVVTWALNDVYSVLEVSVDGGVPTSLTGGETAVAVQLGGAGDYEICLAGSDICSVSFAPLCCTATVETPPVTNVVCTLTDPCLCDFDVTWTNGGVYEAVDVYQSGVLIQTLGGAATSTSVTLGSTTIGGPLSEVITIVGRENGIDAVGTDGTATCPDVPDPVAPVNLSCSVDQTTRVATLVWTNPQLYSSLALSVDGGAATALSATATTTTVQLGGPGVYTLCLDGADECSVAFGTECCTVEVEQPFIRGEVNLDGGYNISDPIYTLNYLFAGGPMACVKSVDANDDGAADISDVIWMLNGIFGNGPLPTAPHPGCGVDPTPDPLSCLSYPVCP